VGRFRDWVRREMFVGELSRPEPEPALEREVVPLEGTNMSLFHSVIPSWWAESGMSSSSWVPGNAALADRVWVANRCIQLNAQQIASMPLQFQGSPEPAWVSSPDPNWYPNGIGDALHSIVAQIYGWGFACLYITDFYADGFARRWTVLDSSGLNIRMVDGAREYKYGEQLLDPGRVVQIDRNPGVGVHGTSALRSYWQVAWGLLAAGNQSMDVSSGGIPNFYLQMVRKITEPQALAVQSQWAARTAQRNGGPPVVPPEIEPKAMSFDPADMALLETQEFNAKAIATAFGVPAVLLNMALQGGLTYQNPAALGEMWWRFELRTTATFDAADTFAPIDQLSEEDDPQASQVAKASPAQQPGRPLTAIGGAQV
jgi:Phage portal protein